MGLKSSSDASDTATTSTDVEQCIVCVNSITPDWGPTAGGDLVTISGEGFHGNVQVSFGRMAIDVSRVDSKTLVITTPPSNAEGPIDVTVSADDGEVELAGGFVYTNSGTDPTPDTGTETTTSTGTSTSTSTNTSTDTSGSGLIGGFVELNLQIDPYGLLPNTNPSLGYTVSGGVIIHDPVNASWLSWIAPEGSCAANVQPQYVSASNTLGSFVYLNTGAVSIPLQQSTASGYLSYVTSALTESQFIRGGSYDLSAPDIGLSIPNAITTTMNIGSPWAPQEFFTAADPFSYGYPASGVTFSWAPDTDPNSNIWFIVEVYDSAGTFIYNFQCRAADTGSYMIPANMFANAIHNDLLVLQFYRTRAGTTLHPQNNSTIETFSIIGAAGTAVYVTQ